jgi:hypothetical protein
MTKEYEAQFNSALADLERMAKTEDDMIKLYHSLLLNPFKLMAWAYSIDAYYLLLFPHMQDISTTDKNKEAKSIGGAKYGVLEGREYFEKNIANFINEAWKTQRENEKNYKKGLSNKIKIDGKMIYTGRDLIKKLKLMKKYLGFEVSVERARNIMREQREMYGGR